MAFSNPSKNSSVTFGKKDPRKQFLLDIKTRCQQNGFPAWDQMYDFNVYQTAKFADTHSYISLCCVNESIQMEYLNIHLFVENDKIFCATRFMDKQSAKKYVVSNFLSQKITVKSISMRQFTKLALDLIETHGKYSKLFNSCQTFSASFISKLQSYSHAAQNVALYGTKSPEINQTAINGSVTTAGAAVGALGGTTVGGFGAMWASLPTMAATYTAGSGISATVVAPGLLLGPVGFAAVCFVGAVGGAIFGGVAANGVNTIYNGSKAIGSNKCENQYSTIQDPKKEKTEQEWTEWELKIMQL